MGSVDLDAYEKAWKGLTVITLVLTVLANLCLLYKVVRAAGGVAKVPSGPRGPRYQTFISLIIGDILVACFALGVQAKGLFESTRSVTCRTVVLAHVYLIYIMPFVYGIGLVVLAVECICFTQRIRAASHAQGTGRSNTSIIVSVVVGAIPWMWGLVVALPLNIADRNLSSCEIHSSTSRMWAITCVCLLIPAVAAAMLAFANFVFRSQGRPRSGVIPLSNHPTDQQSRGNLPYGRQPHDNLPYGRQPHDNNPYGQSHDNNPYGQSHDNNPYGQPHDNNPYRLHYNNNPYGQPHDNNPYGQPHDNNPYGLQPQCSSPVTQAPYLPAVAGQIFMVEPKQGLSIFLIKREKSALMAATLLFCLCTLPFAIFCLAYVWNADSDRLDPVLETVIWSVLFWTFLARSYVLPFMWAMSGSIDKPIAREE